MKGETPLQAIERLKQFKCRFCNIVEIQQFWQDNLLECSYYRAIVYLQEESSFFNQVACTWCGGELNLKNIYIEFSSVVDERYGILVEVDPWLL